MSVARVTEITARADSYEAAIDAGITRAQETLRGVEHVWVKDHEIRLADGQAQHQVSLKVTFVLE
ncbi:dodecin family protein [Euzebya tangerina]|uniref:dodecin family protein n=1 Tax=Euzebya tangerina TaxID=591198 RepID=UPI000E31BAE5|nr:dodecin family protein [Euzebya tangerina]